MLAGIAVFLVDDLAPIDAVPKHFIKGPAGEWLAAGGPAKSIHADFADDATLVEVVLEVRDRAEFAVAPEDVSDGPGLGVIDHQLSVLHVVAERRHAAHPHALLLRGRDLVADALAGDLALELGEGKQDIECQATHRMGRIELLRY